MVMLITFFGLPIFSMARAGVTGERQEKSWKDVFWLVIYIIVGIGIMRGFAVYLSAKGLI